MLCACVHLVIDVRVTCTELSSARVLTCAYWAARGMNTDMGKKLSMHSSTYDGSHEHNYDNHGE